MNMEYDIDLLFDEIARIVYLKKERELAAQKRGEKFNIFELLGLQSNETRLHSALLAELLNPKGTHALGTEPLRLFLNDVCRNNLPDFNVNDAEVIIEHPIGQINESYTEGGRIDILIRDNKNKGNAIIIENKIYAVDQPNQLKRYDNYAKARRYSAYRLCYLTLDGHPASKDSADGLKISEDYSALSYRDDIIPWLNKCRSLAIDKPLVREVIGQYVTTLKILTNTNMSGTEKDLIFQAMEGQIEATSEILSVNKNDFTGYLVLKYIQPRLQEWANNNGLTCNIEDFATGRIYSGIDFTKPGWARSISLQFQGKDFVDLIYGVTGPIDISNFEGMTLLGLKHQNDAWHYGYASPKFNSLTPAVYPEIKNGTIAKHYVELLNEIYQAVIENPKKFPMA